MYVWCKEQSCELKTRDDDYELLGHFGNEARVSVCFQTFQCLNEFKTKAFQLNPNNSLTTPPIVINVLSKAPNYPHQHHLRWQQQSRYERTHKKWKRGHAMKIQWENCSNFPLRARSTIHCPRRHNCIRFHNHGIIFFLSFKMSGRTKIYRMTRFQLKFIQFNFFYWSHFALNFIKICGFYCCRSEEYRFITPSDFGFNAWWFTLHNSTKCHERCHKKVRARYEITSFWSINFLLLSLRVVEVRWR